LKADGFVLRASNEDDDLIEGLEERHHDRFDELVKLCKNIFKKLDPSQYDEFNEILEFDDWAWRY